MGKALEYLQRCKEAHKRSVECSKRFWTLVKKFEERKITRAEVREELRLITLDVSNSEDKFKELIKEFDSLPAPDKEVCRQPALMLEDGLRLIRDVIEANVEALHGLRK